MPFKSLAQERFMYAEHPAIAKRFQAETPPGPLPKRIQTPQAARARVIAALLAARARD